MKTLITWAFCLTISTSVLFAQESTAGADIEQLIGTWILDMSPENQADDNFAMMKIIAVDKNTMTGTFYREGVKMRSGNIQVSNGTIHGALISGDNSGEYHSAFYMKDGLLYGTTHAVQRGFLSVWVATKE